MKIIDYFESKNKQYWLQKIAECDWSGGKFLHTLLSDGTFFDTVGEGSKLLLLTDCDNLLSFCTYAKMDDVQPTNLTPWVGFVYTFPQYRGNRLIAKLFDTIAVIAKAQGSDKAYISTNHTGLYEKYGCEYLTTMKDVHGEDTKVYVKNFR